MEQKTLYNIRGISDIILILAFIAWLVTLFMIGFSVFNEGATVSNSFYLVAYIWYISLIILIIFSILNYITSTLLNEIYHTIPIFILSIGLSCSGVFYFTIPGLFLVGMFVVCDIYIYNKYKQKNSDSSDFKIFGAIIFLFILIAGTAMHYLIAWFLGLVGLLFSIFYQDLLFIYENRY